MDWRNIQIMFGKMMVLFSKMPPFLTASVACAVEGLWYAPALRMAGHRFGPCLMLVT